MKRNHLWDCKVCLEPQNCDCECDTCQRTKALNQPMELENALVRFLRTDTMTLYVRLYMTPDVIERIDNVISLDVKPDGLIQFWTRKDGKVDYSERWTVISLESN